MIPSNSLSSVPVIGELLSPDNLATGIELADYELGGTALLDPGQGLRIKPWHVYLSGSNVMIEADTGPSVLFNQSGIEHLSHAFDQNMRPCVAYVVAGIAYLRWYDTLVSNYVTTSFGSTMRTPRLSLDDKRITQLALNSDIILAYLTLDKLCFRQQRDRFLIEYELKDGLSTNAKLLNIGLSRLLRLQFHLA